MCCVCLGLIKGDGHKVCQVGEVTKNVGLSWAYEDFREVVALMVG